MGEIMVSTNGLFNKEEWNALTKHLDLSRRQAQVASCIVQGMGDKRIAAEIGISQHTVRTYLGRMFAKFEVQDRNELLVHVFRHFRDHLEGKPIGK